MQKVTNNCGSDYGFYLVGEEFILLKGVNSVSESNYAELLKQTVFNFLVDKEKFVVEKAEVKPSPVQTTIISKPTNVK